MTSSGSSYSRPGSVAEERYVHLNSKVEEAISGKMSMADAAGTLIGNESSGVKCK